MQLYSNRGGVRKICNRIDVCRRTHDGTSDIPPRDTSLNRHRICFHDRPHTHPPGYEANGDSCNTGCLYLKGLMGTCKGRRCIKIKESK